MKTIYILTLLFGSTFLVAQNIEISDGNSFCLEIDGTYTKGADVNERPSYSYKSWRIQWSGSRWELFFAGSSGTSYKLTFYHTLDTPTPPATSLSPWKSASTGGFGCGSNENNIVTVSGAGATTTLSSKTLALTKNKLRVYPNPAANRITISGLLEIKSYSIYNILGQGILHGTVANKEYIDIQAIKPGVHFLKIAEENALPFVVE